MDSLHEAERPGGTEELRVENTIQPAPSTAVTGSPGRVVVIGAGPGGMATALACHRVGLQRPRCLSAIRKSKAAGNNDLWPPPQKVLRLIGVDTEDLAAPCHTEFQRNDGRLRADVRLTNEVEREYGGGFIGLLRWGLYKRMLDVLPEGMLQLDQRELGFRISDTKCGSHSPMDNIRLATWSRWRSHFCGGRLYRGGELTRYQRLHPRWAAISSLRGLRPPKVSSRITEPRRPAIPPSAMKVARDMSGGSSRPLIRISR